MQLDQPFVTDKEKKLRQEQKEILLRHKGIIK